MSHEPRKGTLRPWPARLLAGLALVALLFCVAVGCESTDELCDEACRAWDSCQPDPRPVPACLVTGWAYDNCFRACKNDGDWGQGYVDCVTRSTMCCDMEGCG